MEIARIGVEASAPSITISYFGGGRVRRGGEILKEATRVALPDGADLELDGIGRMLVQPGSGSSSDTVSRAETALSEALEAAGFSDRASLDEAVQSRVEAEDRARNASVNLKVAAPDGIETLQAWIAAIPEPAESDEDLPAVGEAEAAEAKAIEALSDVNVGLEKARTEKDFAHREVTRVSAELSAASERHARAIRNLEGISDPEKEAETLVTRI